MELNIKISSAKQRKMENKCTNKQRVKKYTTKLCLNSNIFITAWNASWLSFTVATMRVPLKEQNHNIFIIVAAMSEYLHEITFILFKNKHLKKWHSIKMKKLIRTYFIKIEHKMTIVPIITIPKK